MAPEQVRAEHQSVGPAADVHALGAIFYEMLTGRPPFVGESPVSVAYQHVREQAAPPSSIDEELVPEIDAIVMKALTKNVADRYQSAAAMRADIERFLAGKPVEAPVVPLAEEDDFVPDGETSLFGAHRDDVGEEDDGRRNRWPLILTILGVLALLVLAAVLGPMLFNSAPDEKTVPQVVNLTQSEAQQRITAAGLTVGHVSKEASEDVPKGRVIAQSPDPMKTLPPGDGVDLTVSTGQPDVVVPDILGDDKDTARQKLTDAGLRVKLVKRQSDENPDTVIDSNPRPATSVSKGSLVTVYYSAGPKQVPSVVGLKEGAARAKLQKAGFKVETVTDSQTQSQKGTVLKQSPPAFTTAPQGTTVFITVSAYEPPSETPTPTPSPTPTETTPPTESPSVPPPA